ncbi:MAG: hypothetical protein GY725_15190 [bacterium]|nr:hypothetical protein [bacterium]
MTKTGHRPGRTRALLAAILLVVCWPNLGRSAPAGTQEELREETLAILDSLSGLISRGADQITEESQDPTIHKRALLWKLRMIPYAQDAAFLDDPRHAYGALLGVTISQRLYLTEGDGRKIFGDQQAYAVQAAKAAEAQARAIGSGFFTEKDLERLSLHAENLIRKRPIVGSGFSVPSIGLSRTDAKQGGFDWLLRVPMVPFKALTGVSDGATAIRDFNDTALRFSAIVEALPEQIRWQLELLAFDFENRATVRRSLAAVESLSTSAGVASAAMERLPKELEALVGRSDGTIAGVKTILAEARALIAPLQAATDSLRDAGLAWNEVVRGSDRDGEGFEGRPFDIREWEATLKETSRAAGELRQLAVELRELDAGLEDDAIKMGLLRTVDQAQSRARDLVDHAALRVFQVGLAFFALLFIYRLMSWVLARSPDTRDA